MALTVSTVPACLAALVAAATQAVPEVLVVDGQPAMHQDADDIVCIGFTGSPEDAVVESTRTQQQAAVTPDRESYAVTCLASCWRGAEVDAAAVREGAYALVDAIGGRLAADPTLGGVVGRSRVSAVSLAQAQTEGGAVAVVRFVVSVDAFTGH
jgi:hypothetical protein